MLKHNRVIPREVPHDFHVIWLTVAVKQSPFIGSEAQLDTWRSFGGQLMSSEWVF